MYTRTPPPRLFPSGFPSGPEARALTVSRSSPRVRCCDARGGRVTDAYGVFFPSPARLISARPLDRTRLLDGAPPLSIFRTGPNGRATTLLLCRARCSSVPAFHPPRSGPRSRHTAATYCALPCHENRRVFYPAPVAPLVESDINSVVKIRSR